jgi:succinate dehydrogenase / fumarate reductase cytochrome b subunit
MLVACAGLFVIIFLPVHLITNLFVLPITPDHEQTFREITHFLATFPVIKIIEIVLMAAIVVHVAYSVILYLQNRRARPVRYKRPGHSEQTPFSRFMIHTGIVLALFIVIHFINFYFIKLGLLPVPEGIENREDFYPMIYRLFSDQYYCIVYIILLIPTGFHLDHAFQSAFQTLGLNHPIYTPIIRVIGHIFAIVITIGFISIPVYFLLTSIPVFHCPIYGTVQYQDL